MTLPEHSHSLSFERIYAAPITDLWEAWADAVRISHWFTSDASHDFHVGGRYHNSDGDEGEYLEIVPNKLIRFTWEQPDYAPGSAVTVMMESHGENGSQLRLLHEGIGCDDTEDLEVGWNCALDSLGIYLETGLGISFEEWAAARRV